MGTSLSTLGRQPQDLPIPPLTSVDAVPPCLTGGNKMVFALFVFCISDTPLPGLGDSLPLSPLSATYGNGGDLFSGLTVAFW